MLDRLIHLPAALWRRLADHKLAVALALLVLAAAGGGAAFLLTRDDGEDANAGAPAPTVLVREVPTPEEPEELGFPDFATKNTTRVGGPDPAANAAAIALAVYPATGGVEGPPAVSIVDAGDWAGGIAAASLAGLDIGAPILLSEGEEVSELTEDTLKELDPRGSSASAGRQAFVVGDAAAPDDLETIELTGSDEAEVAADVARLRTRLAGKPDHIVVTGLDNPALAVPAAGWAARSGDPVLFVERDSVPAATREVLEENKNVPVFVLGPGATVSGKAIGELEKISRDVRRVGTADPVANAIAFARFAAGGFGWNINDPGHGFVVASADRPMDAVVAAPLSASGTWGPLLLSNDPKAIPPELRGYLLDLKPGYLDDPTRAVYNHVWVIGDPETLSVELQAQLDEIAEAVPVSSGTGPGSAAGEPEAEPAPGDGGESDGDRPERKQEDSN